MLTLFCHNKNEITRCIQVGGAANSVGQCRFELGKSQNASLNNIRPGGLFTGIRREGLGTGLKIFFLISSIFRDRMVFLQV